MFQRLNILLSLAPIVAAFCSLHVFNNAFKALLITAVLGKTFLNVVSWFND